jgi:hypothetical protein
MRFFVPEQVVPQKRWSMSAKQLSIIKNDYVIVPARNTEGGGF